MATRAEVTLPGSSGNCVMACSREQRLRGDGEKLRIFDDEIALAYPSRVIERGKEYAGVVSAGHDWCDFAIRPQDVEHELLTSIDSSMNTLYADGNNIPSLKALGLWTPGLPCAARYAKDNKWYRARLEDSEYGVVRFVDYGNVQLCKIDEIKPLTRAIAEISPPATIRCTVTEAQDAQLPSYTPSSSGQRANFTILGLREPYEVVMQNSSACEFETTLAVVTFVGDSGCSLYAREKNTTIWAPKIAFSDAIARSPKSLRELIEVGRPAIVRTEPAEKLFDFKTKADRVAVTVELVGSMFEGSGWMFVVCETYSVIVIDGSKGYVFLPNHIINAGDVPLDSWYGTRVQFRAVTDVPDEEKRRAVVRPSRTKALSAKLVPGTSRGPFRCPGVYRRAPPPADDASTSSCSNGNDNKQDTGGDAYFTNVPEELLREFSLLGRDTIGIEVQQQFDLPEDIRMVKENLVNEMAEESVAKNTAGSVAPDLLDAIPGEASAGETKVIDDMPEMDPPLKPVVAVCGDSKAQNELSTAVAIDAGVPDVHIEYIATSVGAVDVESRSVECQTGGPGLMELCEELDRLRVGSQEDMRELRLKEKDMAQMMKLLMSVDETKRQKFFELMKNL